MVNCNEKPKWDCNTTLELNKEMYNLIWQVPDKADKINTYTKEEVDALLQNLPHIVVPTNLSDFTDDLGNNPIHTHSQYLTEHQDLSNYIQKSFTSGLVKNDGTIDTNTYLTQHQDISGKVDKVNTAYNGNFASFNNEGGIVDSGVNANSFAEATHVHSVSDITDFPEIPQAPFIFYATGDIEAQTITPTYYSDAQHTIPLDSNLVVNAVANNKHLILELEDTIHEEKAIINSYILYFNNTVVAKIEFSLVVNGVLKGFNYAI